MPEATPASLALTSMGIPHREFHHSGPINSLEQAAKERNQDPDQVVRSILFRTGNNQFIMVLIAGPRQISWPALRAYLGQSRMTMATDDEVFSVTGYKPGAVSPFGLPTPLRILSDESVFSPEEVSLGSGIKGIAIVLRTTDLKTALGGLEIGKFAAD